jgi:hypothetical protein
VVVQGIIDATPREGGARGLIECVSAGVGSDALRVMCNAHGCQVVQRLLRRLPTHFSDGWAAASRPRDHTRSAAAIHAVIAAHVAALVRHPHGVGVLLCCLDHSVGHAKDDAHSDGAARAASVPPATEADAARARHKACTEPEDEMTPSAATAGAIAAHVLRHAVELACHPYGNFAVQRLLSQRHRRRKLRALPGAAEAFAAAADTPHAGDNSAAHQCRGLQQMTVAAALCRCLRGHFARLATDKYGSHVAEACAAAAGPARDHVYSELFGDSDTVRALLSQPYANYVLSAALTAARAEDRPRLAAAVQPHIAGSGLPSAAAREKWAALCALAVNTATAAADDHGRVDTGAAGGGAAAGAGAAE